MICQTNADFQAVKFYYEINLNIIAVVVITKASCDHVCNFRTSFELLVRCDMVSLKRPVTS